MNLQTEWITFGHEQKTRAYTVKPAKAELPCPAIIVFQEFWGLDPYITDVADRFAQAGYVVVAPDLYAENGERLSYLSQERINEAKQCLDRIPASDWRNADARKQVVSEYPLKQQDRMNETIEALFDWPNHMQTYLDIGLATSNFLYEEYEDTKGQPIGAVGFCLGGGVSALLACHDPHLKGAVVYYGNRPSEHLIPQISCPVLGFYGELDKPYAGQVPDFKQLMMQHDKRFEAHIYENAKHAFFNDTRANYHVRASRDAYARTLYFFNETLNG